MEKSTPYKIGENYFIRTMTHHYTGKIIAVYDNEVVLTDAAWIPEDGRFTQAVANGDFQEVEPYPDGEEVILGRGAILDVTPAHYPLPRAQKPPVETK